LNVDDLDWDEIRRVCDIERTTMGIPVGPTEVRWAQFRPAPHRTPLPRLGDPVLYRHNHWDEPTTAQVVAVQPLDDLDDPMVCRVEVDQLGDPILTDGRPMFALGFDPWPRVTLSTVYGIGKTWEARLRGSPGWLPLDFTARWRPYVGALLGLGEG